MTGWTLDDIPWHAFDAAAVDADLLAVVKTAALVEANAADYVAYLNGVFADDRAFLAEVARWGREEQQHGAALGRWAELADPSFDFARALADFRAGFQVPQGVSESIRGSRAGELVARQVVETGTSSFYSAIRDATAEPVLKAIAGRIAADEFAHYRLFQTHFARYQSARPLPLRTRLAVAATRFSEAEDDELGWAWFAANVLPKDSTATYRSGVHTRAYTARALRLYRRSHIDNGVRMLLRAVRLRPGGWLFRLASGGLWRLLRLRVATLPA
ncbi:MAG: ferritin-like domain-containing protein [Sphingomonadaceae bacterium]|nr:ferritin-like domain-containing protein [Sphingomonadaceae bacterium]